MRTNSTTTTCGQVSDTLNTVTTIAIIPHLTEVHIGMVDQSLAHEGDIRNPLRSSQRPEQAQEQQNS